MANGLSGSMDAMYCAGKLSWLSSQQIRNNGVVIN